MDIDQLQQAVQLALTSQNQQLRDQALEYCNSVRNSPQGWHSSVEILSHQGVLSDTLFFAYQVLEQWIPQLDQQQIEAVQQKVWQHYLSLVSGDPPLHVKSKLAKLVGQLFLYCYQSIWQSFFKDLRALESGVAQEMYARVLCVIHEEIGDTLILHDADAIKLNNTLKDLIRERDMVEMISAWARTLSQTGPSSSQNVRIINQTLQAIAGYVAWMDIGALLASGIIPLIFGAFESPLTRICAADTVHEIVAKKMSPANKLELLLLLDLPRFSKAQQLDDFEYHLRFARTMAGAQLELLNVLNNSEDAGISSQAEALLLELIPQTVSLLKAPTEIASQVTEVVNEYFQWVRKEAKRASASYDTTNLEKNSYGQITNFPADSTFIPAGRRELVKHLFESVIEKSMYSEEDDWEDQDSEFLELRSRLKVLQDQCSSIDIDLFVDEIALFTKSRFENPPTKWQEAELALYELGVFSESIKSIKTPRGVESRPQQVIMHLFVTMINSSIVQVQHPAVQLLYMDLVNRHGQFLERLDRPVLMKALETFVSPVGVHNRSSVVRERSWYLFYKVFRTVRKHLVGEPSVASTIFESIATLLVVGDESEDSFQKKLYLFELCGMLFVNSGYENNALTHQLLERLFGDLQKAVDLAKTEELALQRVTRTIMALGTFTRGMADSVNPEEFRSSTTAVEMANASKMVTAVLQELQSLKVVREACRYTFSRFVSLLGSTIIVEISQLINCLLTTCTVEEVQEFLSFLGQLAHTFKSDEQMFAMFVSLCTPLFERTFVFLAQADTDAQAGSTDSQFLRKELVQAYIQFLQALFNNKYGSIFLVSENAATLESVMTSLFHYGSYHKDMQSQKLAIICLEKIVAVWGSGLVPSGEVGEGNKVPLFDSPEIYSRLTALCWNVSDYSLRDAQTKLVVMELGGLQKCMWEARGEWYGKLVLEYLENAGLEPAVARSFVEKLATGTGKDLKRSFYDFLVQVQQRE